MPRTERLYRVEAIVIRRRDLGEADRLLTLYTREQGKMQAVAKGARKPTSRKAGHLELFTRVRLLVARARSIDIVTQAETIESYRLLRDSLKRSTLAHYFAELLDRFTGEGEADPAMFDLLSTALGWLSPPDAHTAQVQQDEPYLATRYYELRLLELSGFKPELHHCPGCGNMLEAVDSFFCPAEGGVLCPTCGAGRHDASSLPLTTFKVLRYGQTRSWDQFRRLRLKPPLRRQVENTIYHYLTFVLERNLKSVEFLHQLRREAIID
jgi:DNA repair protein RecO (recombination protein O)